MTIKIIKTCAQTGRAFEKGETVTLPDNQAQFLVDIGNAKIVKPSESAPAPKES